MMYNVTFNFAGYIGCNESYSVEAEELAFEMAKADLSLMEIVEEED